MQLGPLSSEASGPDETSIAIKTLAKQTSGNTPEDNKNLTFARQAGVTFRQKLEFFAHTFTSVVLRGLVYVGRALLCPPSKIQVIAPTSSGDLDVIKTTRQTRQSLQKCDDMWYPTPLPPHPARNSQKNPWWDHAPFQESLRRGERGFACKLSNYHVANANFTAIYFATPTHVLGALYSGSMPNSLKKSASFIETLQIHSELDPKSAVGKAWACFLAANLGACDETPGSHEALELPAQSADEFLLLHECFWRVVTHEHYSINTHINNVVPFQQIQIQSISGLPPHVGFMAWGTKAPQDFHHLVFVDKKQHIYQGDSRSSLARLARVTDNTQQHDTEPRHEPEHPCLPHPSTTRSEKGLVDVAGPFSSHLCLGLRFVFPAFVLCCLVFASLCRRANRDCRI